MGISSQKSQDHLHSRTPHQGLPLPFFFISDDVQVEKKEKASDEDIENLKQKYIKELKALYDRHKEKYAPNRKEDLEIVA